MMRYCWWLLVLFSIALAADNVAAQPPTTRPASSQPNTTAANAYERLFIEMIDWIERLTLVIKHVKDEPSARAAVANVEEAGVEARNGFVLRMESLSAEVNPAALEAAKDKFDSKLETAVTKLLMESMRIYSKPELKAVLSKPLEETVQLILTKPATRPSTQNASSRPAEKDS